MVAKPIHPIVANLGRNIYIYNNIQTKQVVYSLTRSLKNNKALKQLTFVGKKSIPSALRKDIWAPLASVSFPFPEIGLKTFRKLREFRKLHETAYPKKLVEGKSKKEKKTILMDQKANSIADLAASLDWEIKKANKEAEATKETKKPLPPVLKDEVVVKWNNVYDAQYVKDWPEQVLHDAAGRAERYTVPKANKPLLPAVPEAAQIVELATA